MDNIEIDKVEDLNRSERRDRLKYYKAEFKKHLASKPKIAVDITTEDTSAVDRLRGWVTREMILKRKIYEFEEYSKRDK